MRKNFINNFTAVLASIMLLSLVMVSCKKQTAQSVTTDNSDELATAKGGSKPNTYPVVSLSMTVNDASGNKIISDNGTPYINGQQNVSVIFDQYGNFMFNTQASARQTMVRWLNYYLNDPTSTNYPVRNNDQGNSITTGATFTSPSFTPLQNLSQGTTQCIGLSGGLFTVSGGVVNFHRNTSTEDTPTTPTSYVYVTRVDATHWTVTPAPPLSGGCSTISSVGALRINGALFGYYNLPFSFTLTAQ